MDDGYRVLAHLNIRADDGLQANEALDAIEGVPFDVVLPSGVHLDFYVEPLTNRDVIDLVPSGL